MAKTLEDIELILMGHGYPCRRDRDACVKTEIPTRAYKNVAGARSITVHLAFDQANGCLTVDAPWAFDSRLATHKEALYACLMAASAETPLVKTQLHPADGEVRLRVDHFAGTDGVPAEGVLKSLSLIPVFADRWYPHIKDAMEKGDFDPSKPAKSEPESPRTSLVAVCERAGGINRVKALLRIRSRDRRDDGSG
jgi:hypothetical protein